MSAHPHAPSTPAPLGPKRPASASAADEDQGPDRDAQELRLVAAIQRGDRGAWAELLTRYQDRLFGVCFRMVRDRDLAEDLTQDAMIKIIEGLATYNGQAKLSTWMIRVTMNVCLSKLRSEKLRRHASLEGLADARSRDGEGGSAADRFSGVRLGSENASGGVELPPELGVELREEHTRLHTALQGLPPEQRALLVLRDCRGLDYDQIADILDVPVGTVKSRLFRARAALREAIEAQSAASVSTRLRPPSPSDP